jgi:hypothetical protein
MALLSVRRIVSRRERMTSRRCVAESCEGCDVCPKAGAGAAPTAINAHRITGTTFRKTIAKPPKTVLIFDSRCLSCPTAVGGGPLY